MRTRLLSFYLAATALLRLMACSVNVKRDSEGKDKNVDITTPFGGIHVNRYEGAIAFDRPAGGTARLVKRRSARRS